MKSKRERPVAIEADAPSPYPPLIIMYGLLGGYGVSSGVVGVATLDAVAGPAWGLLWPFLIALTSLASLTGLLRSRVTSKHGWEIATTLALVALLVTYSLFILIRTMQDGRVERLPISFLPVIISVFPYFRLARLARGVKR